MAERHPGSPMLFPYLADVLDVIGIEGSGEQPAPVSYLPALDCRHLPAEEDMREIAGEEMIIEAIHQLWHMRLKNRPGSSCGRNLALIEVQKSHVAVQNGLFHS